MSLRLAGVPTEVRTGHLQSTIITTTITCLFFFFFFFFFFFWWSKWLNSRCSNPISSGREPQIYSALPCMQLQLFWIGLFSLFVSAFPSGLHIFLLKPTATGTAASIHAVSSRLASIFASQVDFSALQHPPILSTKDALHTVLCRHAEALFGK